VLELLTKCLVYNRTVSIPSVGTFQVHREPARYDVADKHILPPGYRVEFREFEQMDDDQVEFLSGEMKTDRQTTQNDIALFGNKLAGIIRKQPVEWTGIGKLLSEQDKISFQPGEYALPDPVDAPKVIHQGAKHMIRRGETEFTSAFEQQEAVVIHRKLKATTIGWILFLAALAFIIAWFLLYHPGATGLQPKFH
jgi:hypothetical protein